jgi:hypothetical protein
MGTFFEHSSPGKVEVRHTSSLTIRIEEYVDGRMGFQLEPDEVGKASEHLTGCQLAELGAPLPSLVIRALTVRLWNKWVPESLQMAADLVEKQQRETTTPVDRNRALMPASEAVVH